MIEWTATLDAGIIRERVMEIMREIFPDDEVRVERNKEGLLVGIRGGEEVFIPAEISASWPPWPFAFFVAGVLWREKVHSVPRDWVGVSSSGE